MRAIAFYYVITHYFIILGISSWKALTVKLRKPWTPVNFRNVDCVLPNHNRVQDTQANLKTTN